MPIYEYACRACGAKFDQLVRTMSGSDTAKVKCPKCNSTQTSRALSVFAVASESVKSSASAADAPMCGCGRRQGSCGMG